MALSRRGLLGGLLVALAAPAIIRTPGLLMPVTPWRIPFGMGEGIGVSNDTYSMAWDGWRGAWKGLPGQLGNLVMKRGTSLRYDAPAFDFDQFPPDEMNRRLADLRKLEMKMIEATDKMRSAAGLSPVIPFSRDPGCHHGTSCFSDPLAPRMHEPRDIV